MRDIILKEDYGFEKLCSLTFSANFDHDLNY